MSLSVYLPHNLEQFSGTKEHDYIVDQFNKSSREVVFFGELIFGLVLYKVQNKINAEPEKFSINLDISICSGSDHLGNDLGNERIKDDEDFLNEFSKEHFSIVTQMLNDSNIIYKYTDSENISYTIWKFEALVSYPRHKFEDPNLLVSAFLNKYEKTLGTEVELQSNDHSGTLVDYVPGFSTNLFDELNINDKADNDNDNDKHYHLSSSLFEKDKKPTKADNSKDLSRNSIHTEIVKSSVIVPVSPSVVIRLESTKPAGRNDMLLASFNIEASENILSVVGEKDIYFNILGMEIDFKSGTIEEINCNDFPVRCSSSDSLNRIYKLTNNEFIQKDQQKQESMNFHLSKLIEIKLTLEVQTYNLLTENFVNISNAITTNWSPYLDFSIIAPPINNSLKATLTSSTHLQQASNLQLNKNLNPRRSALMNNIYRAKSPIPYSGIANSTASLPNPKHMGSGPNVSNKLGALSSSSVTVNLTTTNNSALSGLRLTFQGKINITLGEIVLWKIQAINNSLNKLNLNLIVQNSTSYSPPYLAAAAQTSSLSSSNLLQSKDNKLKDVLIYSKSQLLSLYNNLKVEMDGVIVLDNNIKMGPLDPNTVYETNITLLGISRGVFNLNGIKVFDTISGDGLDFGKLVEVFVT